MPETLKFEFGGFVLELALDKIKVRRWPYMFYVPFRSQKKACIRIKARNNPKLPQPSSAARLLFDGDTHWKLYQESGHYLILFFNTKTLIHDKSVILSPDFTEAEMHLAGRVWYINDILRPLAEILTVQYLARRQGFLLHGAAVRDHERGYVFSGYSGAGKTTTSKLWGALEGDISILGDERVILRKDDDGWHVYGTPWAGMGFVVANERVPISHLFLIRHGKQNEFLSPSKAVLFQELFTQVFAPFWNPEAMHQIADTCQQLVEEIPCYQFPFVNDLSATEFVRDFVYAAH